MTTETQAVSVQDLLRLSVAELRAVLRESRSGPPAALENRRSAIRFPFDDKRIPVVLRPPSTLSKQAYRVMPCDLSASGIGFLHGAFVHDQTSCIIVVRTNMGDAKQVLGQVVRCRHLVSHIHEVGVQFQQPIDITNFIAAFGLLK